MVVWLHASAFSSPSLNNSFFPFQDFPLHIESHEDGYSYEPVQFDSPTVEWYVNFADTKLFFGYGSPLFAQVCRQLIR